MTLLPILPAGLIIRTHFTLHFTYLGKQVGQGQVRPLSAKIQSILEFPVPETRQQLRRFLGMCGYYHGFCKNFASVVSPLTSLVSPSRQFLWTVECQASFDSAKDLLCSAPVLAAPDLVQCVPLRWRWMRVLMVQVLCCCRMMFMVLSIQYVTSQKSSINTR